MPMTPGRMCLSVLENGASGRKVEGGLQNVSVCVSGLENDEYVRKIEGYLPTAEVAFIDEIFKANSAILNALLTLLNERLFDNGFKRLPVPLLCLVRHMQA
jgi:MoxR-like ATPase